MEMIKTAAFNGCIAGLIICAADTLISGEKFSSQIKLIFSAFFIMVVLSAFRGIDFDNISVNDIAMNEEYGDMERRLDEEMEKRIKKNTEYSLREKFHSLGLNFTEITADVQVESNGTVNLLSVSVITDNPAAAEKILREELREDTEIIINSQS